MNQIIKKLYSIYIGIGAVVMGVMAVIVIASVFLRYFMGITFMWSEELIKILFVFTTFWGMGACVIGKENIIVDILFDKLPPRLQKVCTVISYASILAVCAVLLRYTIPWVIKNGDYLSKGFYIQYTYIYAIMPLGIVLCMLCTAFALVCVLMGKEDELAAMHGGELE